MGETEEEQQRRDCYRAMLFLSLILNFLRLGFMTNDKGPVCTRLHLDIILFVEFLFNK